MKRQITIVLTIMAVAVWTWALWPKAEVPDAKAQNFSATQVLNQIYGSISTDCIQDADADIATVNRIAVPAGRRYVLYCHDGLGAGVACRCLQGTSTVDATVAANDGMTMFAGEKAIVLQKTGNTHISCKVFADDMFVDACPLD